MSNNIIVTGGFGFIGRRVAQSLSARGFNVIGIGRGKWSSSLEQKSWGFNGWISADLSSQWWLKNQVPLPSSIIHCAGSGSVGLSLKDPSSDFKNNVDALLNVLEYARLNSPRSKIIFLSSAAVYGDSTSDLILEEDELNPVSPYGVHKKIAEEICSSYKIFFGLNIFTIRLFSVYGDGLKKQLLWDASNKISQGDYKFFGTGKEIRDWVHIDDVTMAINTVLESTTNTHDVFNCGTGVGTSVNEIVKQLFSCMNICESPSFTGDIKAGDPLAYKASINRLSNLGWAPKVDWVSGVNSYARWFKLRND